MSEYCDYKEMYLTLVRETEKAVRILIEVQKKCEEMYLNAVEPTIRLLDFENKQQDKTE